MQRGDAPPGNSAQISATTEPGVEAVVDVVASNAALGMVRRCPPVIRCRAFMQRVWHLHDENKCMCAWVCYQNKWGKEGMHWGCYVHAQGACHGCMPGVHTCMHPHARTDGPHAC
eukprot:366556-Chlamydomonas_euryale.AAC.6